MALSLIAGLNAAPIAALSQKKVVKTEKVEKVQKLEFDASMVQLKSNRLTKDDLIKRIAVKFAEDEGGDEGNSGSEDSSEGGSQGQGGEDDDAIDLSPVISTVTAKYWGTYYYQMYDLDINDWIFILDDGTDEGDAIILDLEVETATQIAGSYAIDTFSNVYVNQTSIVAESGNVTIEFVSINTEGNPEYKFAGTILARNGQKYKFDVTLPVVGSDYLYEAYCYYYQENCERVAITLTDAPAEPIIETITLPIGDSECFVYSVDISEQVSGYYYEISSEDVDAAALLLTNLEGTFDSKSAFSLDFMIDEVMPIDSVNAVVEAGDDAITYHITFYPHFGGVAYELVGRFTKVLSSAFMSDSKVGIELEFEDGELSVSDYTSDYGILDCYFESVDASDSGVECEMYFYADAPDATTVIPVGTFEINNSKAAGSIMASQGQSSYWDETTQEYKSYRTPLYVATFEEGYYTGEVWYVVSGTMEVSYENSIMTIEINGLTSKDANVHIIYQGSVPTGIEQVIANTEAGAVRKFIDNGQIMVVRDGKVFNILGARVK